MTLDDLLNNIAIQGHIVIRAADEDGNTYDLFESTDFEAERHKVSEADRELEVAYIYPTYDHYGPGVVIEVKEEG